MQLQCQSRAYRFLLEHPRHTRVFHPSLPITAGASQKGIDGLLERSFQGRAPRQSKMGVALEEKRTALGDVG